MELSDALEAYRTFNPTAWVGVYRVLPTYVGIVLVLLGLAMLLFGGGKAFRLLAGPAAAAAGFLWGSLVLTKLGINVPERMATFGLAGLLAVVGFVFPPGALFFAVGIPMGMLVGQIAGPQDWFLGFLPSFLLCGTAAAVMKRHVGAVVSSAAGAWMLVIGLLAALHQVGGLVASVAQQPWGVVLAALFFSVAGSIYQIAVRPSPEEAEKLKQEKLRIRQRAEEKKALEQRWSNYSSNDQK
jgi:hypothetical protein